nr:MAG: RNA-dependent RNA polymerase [Botourmiaviridae sp.]
MSQHKVREFDSLHECLASNTASLARSRLIELCGAFGRIYCVSSTKLSSHVPSLVSCPCRMVHSLKQFSGDLLEGKIHPWRGVIRGLSKRQRFAIAASLFLYRKVLPTLSPDLEHYMDKMSVPSPTPDAQFLRFCERRIERMFPVGWDKRYSAEVEKSVLPVSSCTQMGKSEGGVRQFVAGGSCWYNYDTYLEVCRTAKAGSLELGPSRLCAVDTGGKKRIVSVPDASMNLLRPLHHVFYDRLSTFPWLLRGNAEPSRFQEFVRHNEEVFVSGDYESATDNLNSHVQKFILRKVLENCTTVPIGIRELALKSLSMELTNGIRVVSQTRGQLMGNLLSFPLLCLVNFLAFKFIVRRNVPLLVNGDDIVFRASREESERWIEGVGKAGLTLSPGKTLVEKRFFSLNSTFFESKNKIVKRVPVIRSKSLFGCVDEGVMSVRDRFRAFAEGFDRVRKEALTRFYLHQNRRFILSSRRSVRNGLGIHVSDEALEDVGLLRRETCYLDPTGRWLSEVPLADVVKRVSPYRIAGWSLVRRELDEEVRQWQKDHSRLVVREVWTQPLQAGELSLEEKKLAIKETGWDVSHAGVSGESVLRFSRLAQCSRREAGRRLNRRRCFPPVVNKARGEEWWCPMSDARRRIVFLSSGFSTC